ncbi:MAG: thioesterase family protein [Nanoarchaeota archaeon]
MIKNKTEHRVRYADTDHFGVVYYARYLDWFETGRTEILRVKGITYSDLEKEGYFAPVVKVEADYKKPARYDDIVTVETSVEKIGNSNIKFRYNVFNSDGELLVDAYTINVFITKEMKSVDIPEKVRKALS